MANDAVRLLDHLDIEKVVVLGVSMGGTIAQRVVIDHPERVSALILGMTWARPLEFMRRQHELTRTILRAGGPEALLEGALIRMFTPRFFEVGQEAIDRMIAGFSGGHEAVAEADVLLAQLDALDKHDAIDQLPQISCPTLVVGGRMDVTVPGFASEEIAGAIPGAELTMFQTGHGLMVEEMGEFNERLAEFLNSLPA
jgi:aminoacrylate hydrolase